MLKRIEKLTPAEEALLSAADTLMEGAAPARRRAAETLRERGLPSRKVEAWHYTDLRTRLKEFAGLADTADDGRAWLDSSKPLIEAARLPVINGRFRAALADAAPQGATVKPYEEPSEGEAAFAGAADAVGLINTLIGRGGADIAIAPGAKVEKPLELLHGAISAGASAIRHKVTMGAGASATIIERHESADGLGVQANAVTDLDVADDAELLWAIVQAEGEDATHMAQLNVNLGARAKLTILVLNTGGALVRREINVDVTGEDADLKIRGVNLVGGESHVDVTTVLLHDVPGAVSTELFRNVATARGAGIFQGQIRVAQIAQKTDARMACNTLLLSDEAEFSAKPELEIFADDVQCAHGATVADIEDDHLFYLMARGIPQKQARAMLVQAFVEEAFEEIGNDALTEALNARIENWLEKHG